VVYGVAGGGVCVCVCVCVSAGTCYMPWVILHINILVFRLMYARARAAACRGVCTVTRTLCTPYMYL
jgi:hypothetical protein